MSLGKCICGEIDYAQIRKKKVVISVVFRLQRLWDEEVARVGLEKASLPAVFMRFQKTRFIVAFFVSVLFAFGAFVGPVCKMA